MSSSYKETETTTEITKKNEIHSGSFDQKLSSHSPLSAQAFSLWQEKIGCKTILTPQRAEKLNQLIMSECDGTLAKWNELVDLITKTPFLMGQNAQKWRITLAWLLNPQNFGKVKEGYYAPLDHKHNDQEDDALIHERRSEEKARSIIQSASHSHIQSFFSRD